MAIKTIKEESLTALGNAIRIKTGNEALLEFPNGMVNAISGIETSGAIEALDITANGVYNAPEGVDGYNPITVAVPERVPVVESKEITENGTYTPAEGVDGFNSVVVNVPQNGGLPEEALLISGDCRNRFSNNTWNWYIEGYGNQITTNQITECARMFYYSGSLTSIPFNINCENSSQYSFEGMFSGCEDITNIGKIINARPNYMNEMFNWCTRLRYLPEFVNLNLSGMHDWGNANFSSMFYYCFSLREIPEDFLKELYGGTTRTSYTLFSAGFNNCYCLDEIRGLNPKTGAITSNAFYNTFQYCSRVKNILFATQDDGTPYTATLSNQTIDLSDYLGYAYNTNNILNYNSGITADKEVIDDTTYQALKNNLDWFTTKVEYSRYNHDSAVNTINSLPDTSAFLTTNGGTNTIKFKGAAGSATDGGAINTLTEEEIAVATAKGWTVSLS